MSKQAADDLAEKVTQLVAENKSLKEVERETKLSLDLANNGL